MKDLESPFFPRQLLQHHQLHCAQNQLHRPKHRTCCVNWAMTKPRPSRAGCDRFTFDCPQRSARSNPVTIESMKQKGNELRPNQRLHHLHCPPSRPNKTLNVLNCIHHQRDHPRLLELDSRAPGYPNESNNVGTTVVWLLQDLSTQPQPPVPTFTCRLTLRSSTPSTMTLTARPSQHLSIRKTTVHPNLGHTPTKIWNSTTTHTHTHTHTPQIGPKRIGQKCQWPTKWPKHKTPILAKKWIGQNWPAKTRWGNFKVVRVLPHPELSSILGRLPFLSC